MFRFFFPFIKRMATSLNGVIGPHALLHVGSEAAQGTVLVQILPRVLMEMTALTWERTPK